jgi:hypothetical protein
MRIQWTSFHITQKFCKRLRCNTFALVFLPNPITNFSYTRLIPTDDISSYKALKDNGFYNDILVSYNLSNPMRHKCIPISGWKGSHFIHVNRIHLTKLVQNMRLFSLKSAFRA